jgi:hypothetical protein
MVQDAWQADLVGYVRSKPDHELGLSGRGRCLFRIAHGFKPYSMRLSDLYRMSQIISLKFKTLSLLFSYDP